MFRRVSPFRRAALLLALLISATACETSPVRSGPVAPLPGAGQDSAAQQRSGTELMLAASRLRGAAADRAYLAAGAAFLAEHQFAGLVQALQRVQAAPANAADYLLYGYLEAARALAANDVAAALAWLGNREPALRAWGRADPQQEPVAVLRAAACEALARYGCTASALMQLTSPEAFEQAPWFPAASAVPTRRVPGAPEAAGQPLANSGSPDAETPSGDIGRTDPAPTRRDPGLDSFTAAAADSLATKPTGLGAQRLHDVLWRAVTRTALDDARARAAAAPSRQARGWWDLRESMAAIPTLAQSSAGLAAWQQRYPDHPAAAPWPTALAALSQAQPLSRVAVLLPLSGPLASAGEAVRNGFVAAALANENTLDVRFFDSAARPIAASYEAILAAGAQAIIGPLAKTDVAAMAALVPEVPVLTLNYLPDADAAGADASGAPAAPASSQAAGAEQGGAETDTLRASPAPDLVPPLVSPRLASVRATRAATTPVQFGLAIEDEAESLISHLETLGLERILVLHSEQRWSQRAAARLQAHFQDRATVETFASAKTVTEAVGRGMFIDDSHLRSQQIFREIGTHIEFSPRARDDLDAVVALVDGTEAQVLVPALKFHFGEHLPVFVTGQAVRSKDPQDLAALKGFRVATLPWQLASSAFARETRGAFAIDNSPLAALYALGSDAYRLAASLPWLATYRTFNLRGESGALSMRANGHIRRDLAWGVVSNGTLQGGR